MDAEHSKEHVDIGTGSELSRQVSEEGSEPEELTKCSNEPNFEESSSDAAVMPVRMGQLEQTQTEADMDEFAVMHKSALAILPKEASALNLGQFLTDDWHIDANITALMFGVKNLINYNSIIYAAKLTRIIEHMPQIVADEKLTEEHLSMDQKEERVLDLKRAKIQEEFIEGKRRILKILLELHAFEKPVVFNHVQTEYEKRYGVSLNTKEQSRLFQNKSALKNLTSAFHEEVEVTQTNPLTVKLVSPHITLPNKPSEEDRQYAVGITDVDVSSSFQQSAADTRFAMAECYTEKSATSTELSVSSTTTKDAKMNPEEEDWKMSDPKLKGEKDCTRRGDGFEPASGKLTPAARGYVDAKWSGEATEEQVAKKLTFGLGSGAGEHSVVEQKEVVATLKHRPDDHHHGPCGMRRTGSGIEPGSAKWATASGSTGGEFNSPNKPPAVQNSSSDKKVVAENTFPIGDSQSYPEDSVMEGSTLRITLPTSPPFRPEIMPFIKPFVTLDSSSSHVNSHNENGSSHRVGITNHLQRGGLDDPNNLHVKDAQFPQADANKSASHLWPRCPGAPHHDFQQLYQKPLHSTPHSELNVQSSFEFGRCFKKFSSMEGVAQKCLKKTSGTQTNSDWLQNVLEQLGVITVPTRNSAVHLSHSPLGNISGPNADLKKLVYVVETIIERHAPRPVLLSELPKLVERVYGKFIDPVEDRKYRITWLQLVSDYIGDRVEICDVLGNKMFVCKPSPHH